MAEVQRRKRDLRLREGSAAAVVSLREQGVVMPHRPPHDIPELPEELTDLDDAALMRLFVRLTRWTEYMGVQLAAAEVDEKSSVDQLEWKRAVAIAGSSAKSVTAAKAEAADDEDTRAAKNVKDEAYAFRKMVGAIYDSTDRKAQVVSRELTRRVGRDPRENRAGRWSA